MSRGDKTGNLLSPCSLMKGSDIRSKVKSRAHNVYLFSRSLGIEGVVNILFYLNQTPAFTCLGNEEKWVS